MKNRRFTDYMILFNQPSGKKTRNIQRRLGTVLTVELLLAVFCLIIAEFKLDSIVYKAFFKWIFPFVVIRDKNNIYGMFRSDERKNIFYRTLPARKEILKKAMITAEVNRFICILVYCVFSSGFSGGIGLSGIVLITMIIYIFCVMYVNFKRMNSLISMVVLSVIYFVTGVMLLNDHIEVMLNFEPVKVIAATLSVPAAAAAGFFLNRWSYRSLCSAGRITK